MSAFISHAYNCGQLLGTINHTIWLIEQGMPDQARDQLQATTVRVQRSIAEHDALCAAELAALWPVVTKPTNPEGETA